MTRESAELNAQADCAYSGACACQALGLPGVTFLARFHGKMWRRLPQFVHAARITDDLPYAPYDCIAMPQEL
jgi:hypothetical protein